MASIDRFKCGKQLFTCTHFQDGNCRKYSRFASRRRVGDLTRPYRCVLSHTNTPTVSEVSSLQCRQHILPVHSLTLRNRYGSTRVHHGSKRGETDGFCRRHQDSSVHRRLVNESKNKGTMPREYPQVDSSCSKLGLDNKFRKIRFNSNPGNRVFGLQVRPQGGSSASNSKENRLPSREDSFHVESYSNISKGAHVTDWEHGFNGEDYTIGSSAYEASTMVPHWRYPQSLDIPVPVSQVLKQHLQWWTNISNLKRGSPLHQKENNLLLFTDASLKGWGAHLKDHTASGLWNQVESRLHINILELMAVFLA